MKKNIFTAKTASAGRIVTEGGKTAPEAHAEGVQWIQVEFIKGMRISPTFFSKIGKEHLYDYTALEKNQKQRFIRVYTFFRNLGYEEDTDLIGLGLRKKEGLGFKALKNHLCHTYMSFILSELTDEEIDNYLPDPA